ncbi:MAG TPA: MFS transporter [Gemmatimonadaceae bacterium]|nr:MFS transporter [Gemmatimonadaceae bacterium]
MASRPAAAPPSSRTDPYAALRIRDFRLYVIGNFVGTIGMEMVTVAVGWDLYERTGSALALGAVGLAQVLPVFLLTLPAGHVSDRFDRKRLLIAAQILLALSYVGLAVATALPHVVALVYVFLVVAGIARAFQQPAKDALSPQLIPPSLFGNAATWRSTSWQLAAVLGPGAGGLVIGATHHAAPAYALAAGAVLAFALLIAPARSRPYVPVAEEEGMLSTLVGGVRFLRRTKAVLAAITLDMFAVMLGGATMLLPIYAKDILRVGATGLGWLLAAPAVGALVTALIMAHRPPLRHAGRALLVSVAVYGAGTVVFGLSRSFTLSLIVLAVVGAFDMVSVVIRNTLLQVMTPDEFRGRISAVNGLFTGTSNELGGFESGTLAAVAGPVFAVVIGGVGAMVVVGITAVAWPELRKLGQL